MCGFSQSGEEKRVAWGEKDVRRCGEGELKSVEKGLDNGVDTFSRECVLAVDGVDFGRLKKGCLRTRRRQ